jgi:hypothetical protein
MITALRRVSGTRDDKIFLLENCPSGGKLNELTLFASRVEVLQFSGTKYKKQRHLRYHMAIAHKVHEDVVCLLRDDEKVSASAFWLLNALRLFRNNPRLGLLRCMLGAPGTYPGEAGALDITRRFHVQRGVERSTSESRHTIPSTDDCSSRIVSTDLPAYDKPFNSTQQTIW